MLAKTRTCALSGLNGFLVEVEVDISPGLPAFNIVGLPDAAVRESSERVRAAIRNSGCEFPLKRVTVGLAPADVKKSGPSYDLPIAIGVLLSTGQIPDRLDGALLLGELALDGKLRPTQGILPMVAVGGEEDISPYNPKARPPRKQPDREVRQADLADVRGQEHAKRAGQKVSRLSLCHRPTQMRHPS